MSDDFVAWATVGVTFVVVVVLLILLLLLWRRYPGPQQARGVKFERRGGEVELSDADADAVLDRANSQMSEEEAASAAARAAALREARIPASKKEGRDEAVMGTRRQFSNIPSQSTADASEDQVRRATRSGVFIAGVDTADGAIQNADLGALGGMPHTQNDSQPMTPEENWVDGETQN